MSELWGMQEAGARVETPCWCSTPGWHRHAAAGPAKVAPGQHGDPDGWRHGSRGAACSSTSQGPIHHASRVPHAGAIPSPQNCHHTCMARLQGASWAGRGVCATAGLDMNPDKCGASGTQKQPGAPHNSFPSRNARQNGPQPGRQRAQARTAAHLLRLISRWQESRRPHSVYCHTIAPPAARRRGRRYVLGMVRGSEGADTATWAWNSAGGHREAV